VKDAMTVVIDQQRVATPISKPPQRPDTVFIGALAAPQDGRTPKAVHRVNVTTVVIETLHYLCVPLPTGPSKGGCPVSCLGFESFQFVDWYTLLWFSIPIIVCTAIIAAAGIDAVAIVFAIIATTPRRR